MLPDPVPDIPPPPPFQPTVAVAYGDTRPIHLATWEDHSKEALLLLSTAIFGAVIAFLL
ncbi:hypothetical protein H2201_001151, partial [Coniosporium apollinis]